MRERPILFSGPMVRAILDGRKTQTRRVIKPQPTGPGYLVIGGRGKGFAPDDRSKRVLWCPCGSEGDRLWVRETWQCAWWHDPVGEYGGSSLESAEFEIPDYIPTGKCAPTMTTHYRATEEDLSDEEGWKWRPAIHMPRWACRLVLEIMDVRVERVQDISEADAEAEGVPPNWCGDLAGWSREDHGFLGVIREGDDGDLEEGYFRTAREAFAELWDSINGKRAGCDWNSNPFVWAITFRRVTA